MTLKLYGAAGSCSIAAQIALEETGEPYEYHALRLAAGEQREQDYLAINPRGRVPTLIVDGTPLTELLAILTCIAARYPTAGLLPTDDVTLLAQAYARMSWYASGLHVAIAQVFRSERFAADETAWPAIQDGGRAVLTASFREIEERLTGPWVMGERYTVVDGYTHAFWRWGVRLEMDMMSYRCWAEHERRLLDRPAVARAEAAERQSKLAEAGTA